MKSSDFRNKRWLQIKDKAISEIGSDIDGWIEDLVSDAIQDYIDSDQFCEDACEYCREQGWKEPA